MSDKNFTITKKIFSDRLVTMGGILFFSCMLTNLFNYLFQVAMGRMLSTSEYGLVNSLLAIYMVMSVPLGTILMAVSKETAEYKAEAEFDKIKKLSNLVYKVVFSIGSVCLIIYFAVSTYIKNYVNAPSIIPVILLGISIFVSIAMPINNALLQGLQNFKWLNISSAIAGPLKFIFCLALVVIGFSVSGVMVGLILCGLVTWYLTFLPLKKFFANIKVSIAPIKFELGNIFPILLANLAFSVMTQADMILVKHYFSNHQAGIYASASILGKAVMYLPGALVLAMFPMVAESHTLKQSSKHLAIKSIIVSLLLSGTGAFALYFFPSLITFFFGAKYAGAIDITRYFGLAMLPMAISTILLNYFVAKGNNNYIFTLFFSSITEITLILFFHNSLMSIIGILAAIGGFLACYGLTLLYLE